MHYEVVIAGAGPVGLMLACELRLAGIHVLVLERIAEPHQALKAGAMVARSINAPSADAFYRRGLLAAVEEAATWWYRPDPELPRTDHRPAPGAAAAQGAQTPHNARVPVFVGHFAGLPDPGAAPGPG